MYATDQSKTFGHTAAVTGVDWHPFERDVVVTSSIDGSARLWNIHSGKKQFQMLVCDKVFQPKNSQGKRTTVLCISFHPSGREFAVGTSCGSIQIWNPKRASARPERAIYVAHGNNMRVTSLTYNYDGSKIASRSVDSTTTLVWNAVKMSSSSATLATCNDTNTIYEQANVAFSPDGKILCAGVATLVDGTDNATPRHEIGAVHFYDVSNNNPSCDPILTLKMNEPNVGAVLVVWHAKINQIFVACSNGQIIIYFNPTMSQKGAINTTGKVRKAVDGLTELLQSRAPTGSAAITGEIITPLYNPNLGHKRKRNEIVEETQTLEPERPVSSKHKIGSGGSSGLSFQQYVADTNIGSTSKIIAGNDPREALFKYNEGKAFVDRAYEGNKSKLAEKTAEQEEEELQQKRDFLL
jgi:WD40 repeat protein